MCVPHAVWGDAAGNGKGEVEPKRGERKNAGRMETIVHNSWALYLMRLKDATPDRLACPAEVTRNKYFFIPGC